MQRTGKREHGSSYRIADMDCPTCVAKIEKHLKSLDGVRSVQASVVSRTLQVDHEDTLTTAKIQEEIGRLGYRAQELHHGGPTASSPVWTSRKARVTYLAVLLFVLGLIARFSGFSTLSHGFLVLAALVGGSNFFGKGFRGALRLSLDMHFLMTVAIVGALAIGETLEAAAIAFLFSLAELLETYAVDRARSSVTALLKLAPDTARVIREGRETVVPSASLIPGDRVLVRPGERIPVDGRIERGRSTVDQSPVTGESLPVERSEDDLVFAGSVNGEGLLTVRVDREASESTLARIGRMIQEAEASRSRSEQFVQRFAAYYTPLVTAAAVLVALLPPLVWQGDFETWFVRGLTLLVIACPCALVISTPVAVVSGITAAARRGVLIKGGIYLETLGRIRAMAFDKTGTLTVGHPVVMDVRPAEGVDGKDVLWAAAQVEAESTHPIARAILDAASEVGWERGASAADEARILPGLGASARIRGVETVVGRVEALESLDVEVDAPPVDLLDAGKTLVGVASGGAFLGWIALADKPRAASAGAMSELRGLGLRALVMVTGDGPAPAEAVAAATGMDEIRAGLMPEEKLAVIRALEEEWGGVVMVGDGVNDGPALAAATVGIAMGAAGSDVALETADVALLGDQIGRLPYLVRLSRKASGIIRQNVAAAILVKGILAIGVPLGWVSLVAAVVVGDMGVSLAVILNALRLSRVDS